MMINFKVDNQTLECVSDYCAAEGTENYIRLKFVFSDDWNGLVKAALLQGCGMKKPVTLYLDNEDCCYVPYGISGVCNVSLTGTDGTVTITTGIDTICFEQTLEPGEDSDFDNPTSDFSELMRKMNDLKTEIYENVGEMLAEKADKAAVTETENNIDTINKALTGVYKNKGNVTEMTLNLPLTDESLINNMYNVKDGFIVMSDYGKNGAFRYKINIADAYISEDYYKLCFKISDIPNGLWSGKPSEGFITFDQDIKNVNFEPIEGSNWIYTLPEKLPLSGGDVIVELSASGYSGMSQVQYFSEKIFTDGKYPLGSIETIWYRDDIKHDDNFAITEDGYDLLTYKVSDYVSKSAFDGLSAKVSLKADAETVYTKDEADKRTMLAEDVTGYPAIIGATAIADEAFAKCNIYGGSQSVGTYSTESEKYSLNLCCITKNFVYPLKKTGVYTKKGVTFTMNDDGTVTVNGTAEGDISGSVGLMYKTVGMPMGKYHLSGCPKGGSEDTYMLSLMPSGNKSIETGEGLTFEMSSYGIKGVYIFIKEGTVADNLVFKPQVECGDTGTEYAVHKKKSVSIVFSDALGEGEYIDVINKKLYGAENVRNVSVDGELTPFGGVQNVIYATTSNAPSKIELSYYRDLSAEFDNRYTKDEVDELVINAIANGGSV